MVRLDEDSEYAQKAIDYITHICDSYGERITCTPAEHAASKDVESKLKGFCDATALDPFKAYPDLYPGGFIRITAAFVWAGLFFMFFDNPWALFAAVLPLLGFIQLFITYMKMKEWFGFLFKSGTSYNAMGRVFPRDQKGEIAPSKTRVVIAGHIDSAYQMGITKHGDKVYNFALPGFAYIIVQVLFGIIKPLILAFGDPHVYYQGFGLKIITLDIVFLCFCIVGIPALWYLKKGLVGGTPVMGANDNLSGVGIAVALGEYFSRPENRLHNVELWVGGFGSEECGERGAQAFVMKYGKEALLDNAYSVIPESCGAGDRLAVITKEPIHLAVHNLELCNKVYAGYEDYIKNAQIENPIPCKVQKLPFSASDAGRFSLAGYKATMVIAFEGALAKPKNWHHSDDTPDHLELPVMAAVFGMIKHYIKNLERKLNV
jgi:hypothetical protein